MLLFILADVYAIDTSRINSKKIEPELFNQLKTLSENDKISIILAANHRLNDADFKNLEKIDVIVLKNFTLAPWYEVKIPAGKINDLANMDFVSELDAIRTLNALNDKNKEADKTKTQKSMSKYIFAIILLFVLIFILYYLYKKRMGKKALIFFILVIILPLAFAEQSDKAVNKEKINDNHQKNSLWENFFAKENNLEKYNEKVDPAVYAASDEEVNIIVETENDDDDSIKSLSADNKIKKFQNGKFQALKISKNKMEELEDLQNVKKVWADKWNHALLDVSIPQIGANDIWNSSYNGSGIKVCVLDTGINKTHPALSSRVINESDFTNSSSGATDIFGHGSHVAGIVASTNETYRGVAFGASILNAKVLNDAGSGTDSMVMSGIDWCISQGANILTLSLGSSSPNNGSDVLSQYTDLAVDQGKILTIAAGNSGPSSDTIACPGCAHKVITVGAVYKKNYGSLSWSGCTDSTTGADNLTCFSSRGPTDDNRIKPDVLAPGAQITSVKNTGGFVDLSGTSMSTPMVAGLAALLLQARPTLSPEEMKALLMDSAYDYGVFGKDNNYGAGRINASKAINEINLTARGEISNVGTIHDASRGNISNVDKVHNIYVPSGTTEIRTTLYWPENYSYHSDVDLYIIDPTGKIVDYSKSSANTDEMVKISNPKVFGYWKILASPYSVNGTQKYAIASNILPSEQLFYKNATLTGIVYHQLNISNLSQIKVNLDWNSSNQDLDVYLYNTTGSLKTQSNGTNSSRENLTFDNPENGLWLLKIIPANLSNQANAKYTLTSTFSILNQIKDNSTPIVQLLNPLNTTYSGNINLSFIATDDLSLHLDCYRYLNGTRTFIDSVSNGTQYSIFVSIADGTYSLYVNCTDNSNNFSVSNPALFSVDSTPPNFTINSPVNNSYYSTNSIKLNISINETAKWLNGSLDNGNIINFCTNCSSFNSIIHSLFDINSQFDGLHNLTLLALDSIENIATKTISFTVDTISPSISLINPQNNSVNEIGTPINLNISDANSIFAWYNNITNNITINSPYSINTSAWNKEEYKLTIFANDSANNINSQFYRFIFDSRPKIITTPINSTLEKDSYIYDVNATDADNDFINYSLLLNPSGMIINSANGIINWTPGNSNVGNNPVIIKADDGNLSANQSFILTVINVNDPPNLTTPLPDVTFNEDMFNDSINLSNYFTDVDNATLIYNYTVNNTNLFVTIYPNTTIKLNSSKDWNGVGNVTIIASDGQYNVNDSMLVTVVPVNDAPVLNTIPNIIVNESDLVDINFTGNVMATDVDGDNLIFTYSAPLNSSGKWQTNYNDARNYTINVTVNDGNGGIATQKVLIIVLDKPNGANDTIIGNLSDVATTIPNLNLIINNLAFNSNLNITGTNKINFTENNITLMEFDYNFSNITKFNFINIRINETLKNGAQGLIISGIDLTSQGKTKTVYMNRTNDTYNSVCVKDAEISSISQMTSDCSDSGSNETKLSCDGTLTNGYTCTLQNTTYKITGLSHSGIQQI